MLLFFFVIQPYRKVFIHGDKQKVWWCSVVNVLLRYYLSFFFSCSFIVFFPLVFFLQTLDVSSVVGSWFWGRQIDVMLQWLSCSMSMALLFNDDWTFKMLLFGCLGDAVLCFFQLSGWSINCFTAFGSLTKLKIDSVLLFVSKYLLFFFIFGFLIMLLLDFRAGVYRNVCCVCVGICMLPRSVASITMACSS